MPGVCDEIIDDIEDLISSQDITPKERYSSRKSVSVRSKKRENKNDSEPAEKVILESVVPGITSKVVYFSQRLLIKVPLRNHLINITCEISIHISG